MKIILILLLVIFITAAGAAAKERAAAVLVEKTFNGAAQERLNEIFDLENDFVIN